MEAIAAFLGAFAGSIIIGLLNRRLPSTQKTSTNEPGTGSLKDHVCVEVVKKKTVYRDKEIEKEEQFLTGKP